MIKKINNTDPYFSGLNQSISVTESIDFEQSQDLNVESNYSLITQFGNNISESKGFFKLFSLSRKWRNLHSIR